VSLSAPPLPRQGFAPIANGAAPATRRLRVAAVIPAYNEEGKIGRVVRKIPPGIVDAVVVVDDCSRDRTSEEAREAGATVLRHEVNQGVGAGIRTGIDYARRNGFDVVTVLSGDDQHDPNELPIVLGPLQSGQCDFVQGSRRLGGGKMVQIRWFRRITTAIYPVLFHLCTGFRSTDATNGFRAFRLSILDDKRINLWQDWLNRYELEPYLLYQAVVTGKRVKEVPITIIYHQEGTTKMRGLKDWWRILRPLVLLTLGLKR
jgi:dolichol-phosphate mannosyltransferase